MAEVIDFNERHRERVMPYFGQELMLAAEAKGPLTEEAIGTPARSACAPPAPRGSTPRCGSTSSTPWWGQRAGRPGWWITLTAITSSGGSSTRRRP